MAARKKKRRAPAPVIRFEILRSPAGVGATYPLALISEPNQRGSWRKHRERHAEQHAIGLYLMRKIGEAIGVRDARDPESTLAPIVKSEIVRVVMTRIAPRLLDCDNAVGSAKYLRDGIAEWIGRGDGPKCGIKWDVVQEQSAAVGIRIQVVSRVP